MVKKILLTFGIATLYFFLSTEALAQSISYSISPTISRINAVKPSSVETQISITNLADSEIKLSFKFEPFIMSDLANGSIEYVSTNDRYKKLFESITILDDNQSIDNITVLPHEKKTLTLFIPIFKDSIEGEYYFSVIFSTDPNLKSTSTYISLKSAVASHILMTIGKKGPTILSIEELRSRSLLEGGPVDIKSKVYNKSNHNISIYGNLKIQDMLGRTVDNFDIPEHILLASSKRFLDSNSLSYNAYNKSINEPKIVWNEAILFGKYTATLSLYSGNVQLAERSIVFFGFPFRLFGVIFSVIAFLTLLYLRVKTKLD